MSITKIVVAKDGVRFVCKWVSAFKFKCGFCGRGVIKPKSKKCKVCRAKVESLWATC